VLFFRPSRALVGTLQCIWQTSLLVVSSFAIVPRSWRPSADHAPGSAAGSGSFLARRSRCQAFSSARSGLTFYEKTRRSAPVQNDPPNCPPTGVFLVLKLNFLA
jgi:hypothetical protein